MNTVNITKCEYDFETKSINLTIVPQGRSGCERALSLIGTDFTKLIQGEIQNICECLCDFDKDDILQCEAGERTVFDFGKVEIWKFDNSLMLYYGVWDIARLQKCIPFLINNERIVITIGWIEFFLHDVDVDNETVQISRVASCDDVPPTPLVAKIKKAQSSNTVITYAAIQKDNNNEDCEH